MWLELYAVGCAISGGACLYEVVDKQDIEWYNKFILSVLLTFGSWVGVGVIWAAMKDK